jgi:hypothetical protein
LIAACYGVVHDQITYSISPEYFTLLKFRQFHYADFGFPSRVFVGEIGVLATWWAGFIAGWFIARIVVARRPELSPLPYAIRGFALMLGATLLAGVLGYAYGLTFEIRPETSELARYASLLGATDVPAFTRVAHIHNAGYLGALIGLITAALHVTIRLRRSAA